MAAPTLRGAVVGGNRRPAAAHDSGWPRRVPGAIPGRGRCDDLRAREGLPTGCAGLGGGRPGAGRRFHPALAQNDQRRETRSRPARFGDPQAIESAMLLREIDEISRPERGVSMPPLSARRRLRCGDCHYGAAVPRAALVRAPGELTPAPEQATSENGKDGSRQVAQRRASPNSLAEPIAPAYYPLRQDPHVIKYHL